MKQTGRHPDKALSPAKVRTLTAPGRYADGNGLYFNSRPVGGQALAAAHRHHG